MFQLQVGDLMIGKSGGGRHVVGFEKIWNEQVAVIRTDDGHTWKEGVQGIETRYKTIHRPTPEGLVQVWPEVKG